jgi:hypothetical protein
MRCDCISHACVTIHNAFRVFQRMGVSFRPAYVCRCGRLTRGKDPSGRGPGETTRVMMLETE